jgi:hypothetical protein
MNIFVGKVAPLIQGLGIWVADIPLASFGLFAGSGMVACNLFGLLRGRANYSVPGLISLKAFLYSLFFVPMCKVHPGMIFPMLLYCPIYLNLAEFYGSSWMHRLCPKWLSRYLSRKLGCKLIKTADIPLQCIIAGHPHAILPLGGVINMAGCSDEFDAVYPKLLNRRVIAASSCFVVPGYRELLLTIGVVDCSRACAEKWLDAGYTLCVFPGGAREGLYSNPDVDWLDLKRKTGFIKLALQKGIPIVPAFTFNEVDYIKQLHYTKVNNSSLVRTFREQFQKTFGLSLPFPFEFGFPPDFKHGLVTVVGAPIIVPHISEPPDAVVTKYMNIYADELAKLYNLYAPKFNSRERRLLIS